jgi:hypothetical protein
MKRDDTYDEFDDFLKGKFSGHTLQPSSELWENLNGKIATRGVVSMNKYRKLKIAFYSSVASIAALVLIFGAFYFDKPIQKDELVTNSGVPSTSNIAISSSVISTNEQARKTLEMPTRKKNNGLILTTVNNNQRNKPELTTGFTPTTEPNCSTIDFLVSHEAEPLQNNVANLSLASVFSEISTKGRDINFELSTDTTLENNILIEKKTCNKWNWELFALPQVTSQIFRNSTEENKNTAAFTFSGGTAIGYKLTPRITISTGINAAQYKQSLKIDPSAFTSLSGDFVQTTTIIGDATLNYPQSQHSKEKEPIDASANLWYGELPLKIGYRLFPKIELESSLFYRRLLSTQMDFRTDDDVQEISMEIIEGLRNNNFGISLGVNCQPAISKNITLKAGTEATYQFSSINRISSQKIYPFSLGLKVSLAFANL